LIDEKDGILYDHWMNVRYTKYSQLFKDYDESKPRTYDELRDFLMKGNSLTTGWSSRCPVTYTLGHHTVLCLECGERFSTVSCTEKHESYCKNNHE